MLEICALFFELKFIQNMDTTLVAEDNSYNCHASYDKEWNTVSFPFYELGTS